TGRPDLLFRMLVDADHESLGGGLASRPVARCQDPEARAPVPHLDGRFLQYVQHPQVGSTSWSTVGRPEAAPTAPPLTSSSRNRAAPRDRYSPVSYVPDALRTR